MKCSVSFLADACYTVHQFDEKIQDVKIFYRSVCAEKNYTMLFVVKTVCILSLSLCVVANTHIGCPLILH